MLYSVTRIYAAWHIGIASSSNFVASASLSVVTLCIPDSISKMACHWHVDVTGPEGVLYSFVTLNSH